MASWRALLSPRFHRVRRCGSSSSKTIARLRRASVTYFEPRGTPSTGRPAATTLNLLGGTVVPVAGFRRYVKTLSTLADDLWFAGVTFKATEQLTLVVADYYDKKRDGTDQNDNLLVLRANYALGKIVDLYATYGHASAENGGFAGVIRANDTLPVSADQNGVSLGLRVRYGYPPTSVQ